MHAYFNILTFLLENYTSIGYNFLFFLKNIKLIFYKISFDYKNYKNYQLSNNNKI